MIYDIIPLPSRNINGSLSTVVPLFSRSAGVDDVEWFGKEIDAHRLPHVLFKYKSIEHTGSKTIERMFYTPEPIDFTKKWITARIYVYPIYMKVFQNPPRINCDIYRYLNGTQYALASIDNFTHSQTLDAYLLKKYLRWLPNIDLYVPDDVKGLIPHVMHGDDNQNLSRYANIMDCVGEWNFEFVPMQPYAGLRMFKEDYSNSVFLKDELTIKDLEPITSNTSTAGIYKGMIDDIEVPFEVNRTTICTEEYEYYRWVFHLLIQALECLFYTDIHIILNYDENHRVSADIDMFSRYIGHTTDKLPGYQKICDHIVDQLRKWAGFTSGCTPTKVELWKNWAEEVFIEIQSEKNGTVRYYTDLMAYSLANLSFRDRFE